ncbi:MAG: hypothetical protein IPM82_30140 [Saprospiraceae bacterium]|nr:hypothetical protein [Saprospiraceae bacterium]
MEKGTNLATLLEPNGELVRLFHPRKQNWFEHFTTEQGKIIPISRTGEATARLLEFNLQERVDVRLTLTLTGFFPDFFNTFNKKAAVSDSGFFCFNPS